MRKSVRFLLVREWRGVEVAENGHVGRRDSAHLQYINLPISSILPLLCVTNL